MEKRLANVALLVFSVLVSILICEFAARIALRPVDYLSVIVSNDPVLGHKILPRQSGHDDWGFRNPRVPDSAEIVAIGDSHTYGHGAKMDESWPSVMKRATGKTMYNLGVGGYGPNQYYYLLKNKALQLKPRICICGLYMGDDLDNAYCITYGLDYWKDLRDSTVQNICDCLWEGNAATSWHKKIRAWFSNHSVLYQVIIHGPVLGWLKGKVQITKASTFHSLATVLSIKEKKIFEAFTPKPYLRGVDLDRANTREGLRITQNLLLKMDSLCKVQSIRFVIVVIPTKETTFSKYLQHNDTIYLHDEINRVIAGEQAVKKILFDSFKQSSIEYVDVTPSLQAMIDKGKIYTDSDSDMHPNRNGYRIIGECVARYLDSARVNR